LLQTHQFEASNDAQLELRLVLQAGSSGDWAEQYSAIDRYISFTILYISLHTCSSA
jgi:hypothetical protein